MTPIKTLIDDFLAQERIAVAGVSRGKDSAANGIYLKLRDAGYDVFATNPEADSVEGDPCYPNLAAIPGRIDGVMIATAPKATEQVVRECAELGIKRVWMHRSIGAGSVSEDAVVFCRENGISVIPGWCPMMFCEPVDFAHKCMRWWYGKGSKLPQEA
jgi:predicted CoA-binding protein